MSEQGTKSVEASELRLKCRDEKLCMRIKAKLPKRQSEVGYIQTHGEMKLETP